LKHKGANHHRQSDEGKHVEQDAAQQALLRHGQAPARAVVGVVLAAHLLQLAHDNAALAAPARGHRGEMRQRGKVGHGADDDVVHCLLRVVRHARDFDARIFHRVRRGLRSVLNGRFDDLAVRGVHRCCACVFSFLIWHTTSHAVERRRALKNGDRAAQV